MSTPSTFCWRTPAQDGQFDTADAIRDELMAHTVSSRGSRKVELELPRVESSRRPGSNNDRGGGRGDVEDAVVIVRGRGGDRGGRGGGGGGRRQGLWSERTTITFRKMPDPFQSMYSEPEIHEMIAERLVQNVAPIPPTLFKPI
jgi:hypothetical protein